MTLSEWVPHADGFVTGDVGVFPYHFGTWEVWVKIDSEWQRDERLKPFRTMDEAKTAATRLHGQGARPDEA